MRTNVSKIMAIVALCFCTASTGKAESADSELEEIVKPFHSLSAFLININAVELYYRVAAKLYGGPSRFPKTSYRALIDQMITMVPRVPEIDTELWRVNSSPQVIEVESDLPLLRITAEEIEAWRPVADAWRDRLEHDAVDRDRLASVYEKLLEKVSLIEGLSGGAKAKGFAALRDDSDFKAVVATFILEYIKDVRNLEHLAAVLRRLELEPGLAVEGMGFEVAGLKTQIRNTVLSSGASEVGEQIFSAGTFRFQEPARKFHAVFWGVFCDECVGGVADNTPDKRFDRSLHPERWALGALKSVQVFGASFVPLKHPTKVRNLGFLQYLHGEVAGIPVTDLTLSVPAFQSEFPVTKRTLFSHWLEKAENLLVQNGQSVGFVISEADNFERLGMLEAIRTELEYILGPEIGFGAEFKVNDPTANKIVAETPIGQARALLYTGRMIADATIPQASYKPLTLLEPLAFSPEHRSLEKAAPLLTLHKKRELMKFLKRHGLPIESLLADPGFAFLHRNAKHQKFVSLAVTVSSPRHFAHPEALRGFVRTNLLKVADRKPEYEHALSHCSKYLQRIFTPSKTR